MLSNESMNLEEIRKNLADAEMRCNHEDMVTNYWKMASYYENKGDLERARSYYRRFDTIVGSENELYVKYDVEDKIASDKEEEIRQNETTIIDNLLYDIVQKSKQLTYKQKLLWIVLSLCRQNKYISKFAMNEQLSMLGNFEDVIKLCGQTLINGNMLADDSEEYELIEDFTDAISIDIEEVDTLNVKYSISVPEYDFGVDKFTLSDFDGDAAEYMYEISDMLENILEYVSVEDCEEDEDFSLVILTLALHPTYAYRTSEEELNKFTYINKEIFSIWLDYEFILASPDSDRFVHMMDRYLSEQLMKEDSYMLAIPQKIEDLSDINSIMQRLTSNRYFKVKEMSSDDNENPRITVEYKGRDYAFTMWPEDFEIPEMFKSYHQFTQEEIDDIEKVSTGLLIKMEFSEHVLDSYHLQLKIINSLLPDATGILDYSSEKIVSGKWAALAAQSEIAPAPRYIYTVQAVCNSDDDVWLHSHGLARCGIKELEVLNSTKASYQDHYAVIDTIASRLIEDPQALRDDHGIINIARLSNEENLIVTWVPWDEAIMTIDEECSGGKIDRDYDIENDGNHHGYTGALFVYRSEEDYTNGHYEPLSVYDNLLSDNPMYYLTNSETDRMSALARERASYMKKAFESGDATVIIKVGLFVDEEYVTETNSREHIWFELQKITDDSFTAVLTQEPYAVSNMHKGSVGTYSYDMITDWIVFENDIRITPDEVYLL